MPPPPGTRTRRYVLHEYEAALVDCADYVAGNTADNDGGIHAWDEGWAFYAGSLEGTEDEYIELANIADATVDLSGVTIFENDLPDLARHTFADGTVLKAGEAIVVFGGGDASALSADNASFVVANNEDSGLQYGLALRNDGDRVTLLAIDGVTVITELGYGDIEESAPDAMECSMWGNDFVCHVGSTRHGARFAALLH